MTVRRLPFSRACVRKTRSPQTMGEELPPSGKGVFQRMFSVALHLTGRFFSGECPCPSGPRQAGQLPAAAAATNQNTEINAGTSLVMKGFLRNPAANSKYTEDDQHGRGLT